MTRELGVIRDLAEVLLRSSNLTLGFDATTQACALQQHCDVTQTCYTNLVSGQRFYK